jgi:hypothetical protein
MSARRIFRQRGTLHAVQAGAGYALCGVNLLGAERLDFGTVDCERCAGHRFETTPGLWDRVAVIGDGVTRASGLPESTAGF